MRIEIESEHLNGVVVLRHPEVFEDERGFFVEVYRADQFEALGLPTNFVQDNHSRSRKGVLRGLHFQCGDPLRLSGGGHPNKFRFASPSASGGRSRARAETPTELRMSPQSTSAGEF